MIICLYDVTFTSAQGELIHVLYSPLSFLHEFYAGSTWSIFYSTSWNEFIPGHSYNIEQNFNQIKWKSAIRMSLVVLDTQTKSNTDVSSVVKLIDHNNQPTITGFSFIAI